MSKRIYSDSPDIITPPMDIDFLLIATWSEMNQKQISLWAEELASRDHTPALLYPEDPKVPPPSDVVSFTIDAEVEPTLTPAEAEQKYNIPSLDYLVFTEQQMFSLGREAARDRALSLLTAMEDVLGKHSICYSLQIRGPEIHRLLTHYYTNARGGTSLWADFSPFEGTFALQRTFGGPWDTYDTVPYEDIPSEERQRIWNHVRSFREEKKFYEHDSGKEAADGSSPFGLVTEVIRESLKRQRPGRLHDQIIERALLRGKASLNDRLCSSVEKSRRLCENSAYVFFPLQYPIESRLTLFSPQFYDQTFLIEYLSRILPASVELFVKGHPNHPGRPSPITIFNTSRTRDVTFLHHSLSAHEVIQHAEAVVVTNNTVGFETIYYQKPLMVLGSGLYSGTPAATQVTDLQTLPHALVENIGAEVTKEDVISSLYSLQEASYDGSRPDYDPDNITTLVDSVFQFLDDTDGSIY